MTDKQIIDIQIEFLKEVKKARPYNVCIYHNLKNRIFYLGNAYRFYAIPDRFILIDNINLEQNIFNLTDVRVYNTDVIYDMSKEKFSDELFYNFTYTRPDYECKHIACFTDNDDHSYCFNADLLKLFKIDKVDNLKYFYSDRAHLMQIWEDDMCIGGIMLIRLPKKE